MTLHYRKLLIASLAFPILVIAFLALTLPSLMESRSSAAFSRLRAHGRKAEQLAEVVAYTNSDPALEMPIEELREAVQRQQDGLVDLRDVMLADAERSRGGGWLPILTGAVAMIGTLSSVILSWRQDMRQSQAELLRLRTDTSSSPASKAA